MSQPGFLRNDARLDYMDVLRGFTIILVVYSHLCVHVLDIDSAVNHNLIRFRMPLFFFISGFFACCRDVTLQRLGKRVGNRITRQLWPTVAVCVIFVAVTTWERPLVGQLRLCLFDPMKRGYWFTYSLVEVFLLYAAVESLMWRLRASLGIRALVCGILAAVIGLSYFVLLQKAGVPSHGRNAVNLLSLHRTLQFGPFFFAGVVARFYQSRFMTMLSSCRMASLLTVVLAISLAVDYMLSTPWTFMITSWLSVPVVISVAYALRDKVGSGSAIGSLLIYFGKNTLPVYLFHYFLISLLSATVGGGEWLSSEGITGLVVEMLVVGSASVLIVGTCLLFDRLLGRVSLLHRVLFWT